jgi:hypothetical protein
MLKDEALLDPQSHKPVMRSLVQLVSAYLPISVYFSDRSAEF